MSALLERPAVRALAQCWFGLCRLYYRARYRRRLVMGPGVIITGRLRLVGRTRLSMGAHSVLRQSVRVDGGGQVTIGAHTRLNGDCWIGASTSVTIGDWCLISDCSIFDDDFHNVAPALRHLPPRRGVSAPIEIGDNVWIGTRSLVTKGVAIGDDSVIGAGSVVRTDIPPGVIVIGNPAAVVRTFTDSERQTQEWPR